MIYLDNFYEISRCYLDKAIKITIIIRYNVYSCSEYIRIFGLNHHEKLNIQQQNYMRKYFNDICYSCKVCWVGHIFCKDLFRNRLGLKIKGNVKSKMEPSLINADEGKVLW